MDVFWALLLAVLQGATEFLPVSSSGHLVLLHQVTGFDPGLRFDIVLHAGTLLAVLVYYRKIIVELAVGSVKGCLSLSRRQPANEALRTVALLLLATCFTAVLAFALKDVVEIRFRSSLVVGILLVVNAFILLLPKIFRNHRLSPDGRLHPVPAVLIGIAQGLAVLPGISRSGSTITTALLCGIERTKTARYSFLLSIPVIVGALILSPSDEASPFSVPQLVFFAAVAAAVGYISLIVVEKLLKKAKLHHFSWYCLAVGLIALFSSLFFG